MFFDNRGNDRLDYLKKLQKNAQTIASCYKYVTIDAWVLNLKYMKISVFQL